ncbi:hypothetical protein [Niastella populi]|uniref:DUF4595 domain-containing protein n=1 Tax=Niastella populi TaxID=550983 RepID=A0A1V9F5Q9_9BACT|nr:hypothetical protein [Niastella populi]OQP53740.1 hypothetical protein A4R26_07170 [Niastella populi]
MQNRSGYLWLVLLLSLLQLAACKPAPPKKDQPPPPAPPTCLLQSGEHIYGKPKEIVTTTITDRTSTENTAVFDWASRKVTYLGDTVYLGADLRPDSSVAIGKRSRMRYLKTPYFKEYYSYLLSTEPAEYHYFFEVDTVKRQVRKVKENPADTSEYTIDDFSAEGFLIHKYAKLGKMENYHVYYTNDNHGNPVEERMVTRDINYIQYKYEYEYDKEGNWVKRDVYRFYPDGLTVKMEFTRKITY